MDFASKQFRQKLYSNHGRQLLLIAGSALFVLVALLYLGQAPAPIELNRHHQLDWASLKQRWAQGDMVVLVRHLERCDHTDAPCLSGGSGITRRAVAVARNLGQQFRQLGLANTEVLNSPTQRAVQSANFIFGATSVTRDWLATCRNSMDKDVFAHKQPGHNLILLTHSECIAEFEKAMHLKPVTLGYGSALFITDDPATATPQVLGYIDSDDWQEAKGQ